jgi:hypothetical protein
MLSGLYDVSLSPLTFCEAMRVWLGTAPAGDLALSLAAARAFLAGRWSLAEDSATFERQLRRLANNEVMDANAYDVIGAQVVLHFWEATLRGEVSVR